MVTIVLVEGKDIGLPSVQGSVPGVKEDPPSPLVKFRLGNGKYKSKVIVDDSLLFFFASCFFLMR